MRAARDHLRHWLPFFIAVVPVGLATWLACLVIARREGSREWYLRSLAYLGALAFALVLLTAGGDGWRAENPVLRGCGIVLWVGPWLLCAILVFRRLLEPERPSPAVAPGAAGPGPLSAGPSAPAGPGPVDDLKALDARRVGAWLIDVSLLALVTVPLIVALGPLSFKAALLGAWGYVVYFFVWETTTGQTAGKRLMGLRVLRRDGSPADPRALGARSAFRIVEEPVLALLLLASSRRRRQRLGDLAAGTTVGRAENSCAPPASRWRVAYPALWALGALVFSVAIEFSPPRPAASVRPSASPVFTPVRMDAYNYLDHAGRACNAYNREVSRLPEPVGLGALPRLVALQLRFAGRLVAVGPRHPTWPLQDDLAEEDSRLAAAADDFLRDLRRARDPRRDYERAWSGELGDAVAARTKQWAQIPAGCVPVWPAIAVSPR